MPLALVFTSAPQGLSPGRSGFCTVARHAEMPERLAGLLEGLGTPHAQPGTASYTFRHLEAGGRRWHILSRFTAGGLDYTRRDNRIAHHLAFDDDEVLRLPPPAEVAGRWQGWISEWTEPPRWLEPLSLQLAAGRPLVPCSAWRRATGTGAKAAWLAGDSAALPACLVNHEGSAALLELLAESAALLGRAAWDATFTTDASVTGADGFTWCGGEATGRRRIDLELADGEPAPAGERARLAALGIATGQAGRGATLATPAPDTIPRPARVPAWIIAGVLAAGLAAVSAVFLTRQHEAPPPPRVAPTPVTTPEQMAAAADLLRASAALREMEDVVIRGELVAAAKQWKEIALVSPEFAARHRDQFVPRIQAGICQSAADSIGSRLDMPGVAENPQAVDKLLGETREAQRVAAEIGAPRDAAWNRLADLGRRAELLRELDIRDTWLVAGHWQTASAGPGAPSAADFDLGRETGEAVARFLREGLTGGAGTSTPVTIRLCDLGSLAARDAASRPLRAKLEPGASSLWVTEDTGGARRPTVTVSVGSRANVVNVNFPGSSPAGFTQGNHAVELTNATGRRLCIALLANPSTLNPLQPGLTGLSCDPANQVVGPATWIEPVFSKVRMAGGRIGLYPAGHEFPDRAASLTQGRNLLDTNLRRLANGNGGMPRAEADARRKLLEGGDLVSAGGPWSIRFVDASGNPLLTLAEFH